MWIPIDHGITAYFEPGLNRMDALIPALIAGGADAVVAQKGIVADWAGRTNFNGFVAHLSVSTVHGGQEASTKVLVGTAAAAQRRGAVAVSAQVNLGTHGSSRMIEDLGRLTDEAHDLGIPVLGIIYPRAPTPRRRARRPIQWCRTCRTIGLRARMLRGQGSLDRGQGLLHSSRRGRADTGAHRRRDTRPSLPRDTLHRRRGPQGRGGRVCMGRAVFTSPDPERSVRALVRLIHEGATPPAAWGMTMELWGDARSTHVEPSRFDEVLGSKGLVIDELTSSERGESLGSGRGSRKDGSRQTRFCDWNA